MGIFADDAPLDARRESTLNELMQAVPVAFRIPMRPQFAKLVNGMTDEQLRQVVEDLRAAQVAANNGDIEGVVKLARHWASDEQIREYLPMAQSMLSAG